MKKDHVVLRFTGFLVIVAMITGAVINVGGIMRHVIPGLAILWNPFAIYILCKFMAFPLINEPKEERTVENHEVL